MKIITNIYFFLIQTSVIAQPLSAFNMSFQYNPDSPIQFKYRCFQKDTSLQIFFQITLPKNESITDYRVSTFFKESYENTDIIETKPFIFDSTQTRIVYPSIQSVYVCNSHVLNSILIFQIDNIQNGKSYFFDIPLLKNNSYNPFFINILSSKKIPLYSHFISTKDTLSIDSDKKIIAYYSQKEFLQSMPAGEVFADTTTTPTYFDSSFAIASLVPFTFKKQGLYILQEENNPSTATAIRAETFYYPRYVRIEEIVKPMIYILTDEEYKKILTYKKKNLDNVLLSITNSVEKSKDLMQKYFRKITSANALFTSYKEGWKTDRGCIYTLFGKPDVVEKFSQSEIWTYIRKEKEGNLKFSFQKKTILSSQEYILERHETYQLDWYNVIEKFRLQQDK